MGAHLLKAAVWLHRWLGIVLCLFFAVWFVSGAVLLFVPFPSLSPSEAAARSEAVPLGEVRVSPAAALAAAPSATDLELIGVLRQPIYVLSTAHGDEAVSAVTGRSTVGLGSAQAAKIAAAFGGAPAAQVSLPLAYDQWIVHQAFDHARPMFRVALADGRRTELYVSARTGKVVQETRGAERAWNWFGAVVHWLYFVPLRKIFTTWDQTVWWISLASVVVTLVGVGLGVYRTTKKMGSLNPGVSPYKGWLRWHHILGICACLFVFTWTLSGWLSMDHGRLFSRGVSPIARARAYAGLPLAAAARQISVDDIRALGPATAVRFNVLGGRLVTSTLVSRGKSRVLIAGTTASQRVPTSLIAVSLQKGWPDAGITGPISVKSGDFYAKSEGLPLHMEVYRLSGNTPALFYVDPLSGRIIAIVDHNRAAYDWVYYGLHTFNFPYLLEHPLLRDLLVLPLLTLGFAFCVTSISVSFRRLRSMSM